MFCVFSPLHTWYFSECFTKKIRYKKNFKAALWSQASVSWGHPTTKPTIRLLNCSQGQRVTADLLHTEFLS